MDDYYKVFGSGTQLIVIDPNSKQNKVKELHLSVYPVSKPQNGKSVLLCQARGMFPDLVRFKWQAKDQSGQDVELKDDELLEQRDENPEVKITSMLIVDEDKAKNNKFTCSVQHDISIKDKKLDIPTGEESNPGLAISCPTQEGIMNIGVFELSRTLYLFSVTYVILLLKNALYFCTVSLLLFKRNAVNMQMIKGKAR